MKRKELTKTFMMTSTLQQNILFPGSYKKNSAPQDLMPCVCR